MTSGVKTIQHAVGDNSGANNTNTCSVAVQIQNNPPTPSRLTGFQSIPKNTPGYGWVGTATDLDANSNYHDSVVFFLENLWDNHKWNICSSVRLDKGSLRGWELGWGNWLFKYIY
jgi:hypothetical protein